MTPPTFRSNDRHDIQPRKQFLSKGLVATIGSGLAVVVLVAAIAVTFYFVRGANSTATSHSPQTASGPAATATADQTAVATTTAAATVTASGGGGNGSTPTPSATERNDVQVTQNQNFNPTCTNASPSTWTVQLTNTGTLTVSWQAVFPPHPNEDLPWGQAQPSSGTLGPGQSGSFVMSQYGGLMPCGSDVDKASVALTYPSGSWQPDLPLTYVAVGPIPESNVVLTSGSLTNSEACPASGVAPTPFTFAIENNGNAIAVPDITTQDDTSPYQPSLWADIGAVPSNAPSSPGSPLWLYPGETWTVTVSPKAGVLCDGTVYHVNVSITDARKPAQTMTFTYTFG